MRYDRLPIDQYSRGIDGGTGHGRIVYRSSGKRGTCQGRIPYGSIKCHGASLKRRKSDDIGSNRGTGERGIVLVDTGYGRTG